MSRTAEPERRKLGELDALRGIAILGVLMVHTGVTAPVPIHTSELAQRVILSGQRGVQLFFMVSAFTLAMSRDRRRGEKGYASFFIRRYFRIAPMFYLAVVASRLLYPERAGSWLQCVSAMLFVNGLAPSTMMAGALGGWSVANEALFYLCLPLLLRVITNVRVAAFAVAASALLARALISICTRNLSAFNPSDVGPIEFIRFLSMIPELPIFLMGLLAYQVWKPLADRPDRREWSSAFLCLAVALFALLLPMGWPALVPESVPLVFLLLALALHPWPFLVNRATILLGKISFSVYLIHALIYFKVGRLLHAHYPAMGGWRFLVLTFVLGVAGTLPLALLTWRYIEQPGIALGGRIIRRHKSRSASVPLLSREDTPGAQF